jgi:hypothetical protein
VIQSENVKNFETVFVIFFLHRQCIKRFCFRNFQFPYYLLYLLTRTAWAVFKYCGTKTETLGLSIRSLYRVLVSGTRWGYPCLAWARHPATSPPPPRPPSASPYLNLRGLVFNFINKKFLLRIFFLGRSLL